MAPHTMPYYNPPERCKNCGRTITAEHPTEGRYHGTVTRVTINHDFYGCDTGCCGHYIRGYNERGDIVCSDFTFHHPDADTVADIYEFTARQVREVFGHHIPVDLENSDLIDD